MAAPAYQAKGTKATGTGSSISPTYPAVAANDLLFLFVASFGNGTITPDASWTQLSNGVILSPAIANVRLYFKLATGSETGTEAVTRSGESPSGQLFMAQIYSYRGTVYISIEDAEQPTLGGNATTITWNALNVLGTERTLAAFVINYNGLDPGTPTSYTNSATDNDGAGTYMDLNTYANQSSAPAVTGANGSTAGWTTIHVSIYHNTPAVVLTRSYIVN